MRRRITLYIDGRKADLADDGLILMNWVLTDLTSPAAIRNAYSHDVELPRTDTNARIFGSSFRLDRNAGPGGTGVDFNASRRTPFTIFAETGEVLAAGYCRLNAVKPQAYDVSLFGGLGDFLQGLSIDADGNKRTLASLDYGTPLEFTITQAAVAQAWARLAGDDTQPAMWDVVNFAPCYDGIPTDFQAGKAVAIPGDVGLAVPAGKQTRDGYVMVNLQAEADAWAAKDMRSYLQRPVVSMRKILEAIADPANNGGWSVDLSDLVGVPYLDTWLTRPPIPSLGSFKQVSGDVDIEPDEPQVVTSGNVIGSFSLSGAGDSVVDASVTFRPAFRFPSATGNQLLALDGSALQVMFLQAVGYDGDGVRVAAGEVLAVIYTYTSIDVDAIAASCGYTPKMGASIRPFEENFYEPSGTPGIYQRYLALTLDISGAGMVRIDIECSIYRVDNMTYEALPGGGGIESRMTDEGNVVTSTGMTIIGPSGEATTSSGHPLRTGARITKEMLLTTAHTPADYLVSFCKLAGLAIVADGAARMVRILRRGSLFTGEVIDITGRVDRSRDIDIRPLAFDAKWYDWKLESVGGRFEKQYLEQEGVDYGIQRVDTGYEFDADEKDVLAGSAFRSAAAVCDRSAYWYTVLDGGILKPALFRAPGNTMTVWDSVGNSEDVGISVPSDAAVLTPVNPSYPGYDLGSRAEFRDASNKAVDGTDVLLFHVGQDHLDGFGLSDDLPVMEAVADGPCWLLSGNAAGLDVPHFTRYTVQGGTQQWLLDLGHPREIDIPGIDYAAGVTVYEAAWAQYIRDRLSVHGKILTARVDLSGLPAGPELLRRFYWYEGSLWVLSSIRNHSLTTFDPAECEFIQVRDTAAYTGGQSY